ncbi:hypothetical protein AB0O67_24335 [Streptomyces sp. NPDC086077]|uniref:hypothetical protein n=1 Tax=Streptomyces sp. NPDC086077 TaxID=3154862 RepID=UPI00342E1148
MSADGGRVRPGNAGLAQFGPHEKTWAKLLRWAVAEGWLLQVERGGARRGPNGTTIVRASVYAASVPQPVWERRLEILGAPPFRAPGLEGSASDALKGAPEDSPHGADSLKGAPVAPFNAPDPSLKGAPRDSLPESLKGAIPDFEGSDPSFEGSVPGFEGSAQALPHHVVPSRSNSSSTTSTTSVAEAPEDGPVISGDGTEGGGGGEFFSSEDQEQDKPLARAESFVDGLTYRGRQPGQTRRAKLTIRVAAAFKDGWTENGLRRYLDISDDPSVRDPAAVYAHRLKEEELPEATMVQSTTVLPPACDTCLRFNPAAATDVSLRHDPTSWTEKPCPNCHPAAVGKSPQLPEACQPCLLENPHARTNIRFRTRVIDGEMQACPDCHPKRVAFLARQSSGNGDMWDRAMVRARQRMATGARADTHSADDYRAASVEDLFTPRGRPLVGTDAKVAGWLALSRQIADEERQQNGHQPYQNPADQSVYEEDFGPGPAVDGSSYDGPL